MTGIELSAGTLEYVDTGGDGPVLVLLHGLLMDGTLWDGVVAELAPAHRCIVPTLPLGAHRHPCTESSDLSLPGVAGLVVEFLERLGVADVTLVGNDTGGALVQLLMAERVELVGRAVLVSCDAFDNFPPGLTGRMLVRSGRLSPTLFGVFLQQLRVRPVRRSPLAFGRLTRRGDAATKRWTRAALSDSAVRRDTVRVLRSIAAQPSLLVDVAGSLPKFDRPALVVWAAGDRVMPPEHGRRLAGLLPDSTFVEIEDSDTLVPLDQPVQLARLLREFVAGQRRAG